MPFCTAESEEKMDSLQSVPSASDEAERKLSIPLAGTEAEDTVVCLVKVSFIGCLVKFLLVDFNNYLSEEK